MGNREIREIIDAYKQGKNPPNVQKYLDEHPEEAAEAREVAAAYKRGETPASVLKQAVTDEYRTLSDSTVLKPSYRIHIGLQAPAGVSPEEHYLSIIRFLVNELRIYVPVEVVEDNHL